VVADTLGLQLAASEEAAVQTIEPITPTTSTSVCCPLAWRGGHRRAGSGVIYRSHRPAPCWPAPAAALATPSRCRGGRHHRTSHGGCGHSDRAGARRLAGPEESGPQRVEPIQPWHSQPQPAWQGSPLGCPLAQASLQKSKAPLRKGVSGCTVQLHPGQAHFRAVGFSRVVVMASPCTGHLHPLWSRRR